MKRIFVLIFILAFGFCHSQLSDTSNLLNEFVKTTDIQIKEGNFSKSEKLLIDNLTRNNESIDQILESETINYLKYYGPGNLSTISSRGGNAQQSSVVYKDFTLNNPLNGSVDMSSIPLVFFNSINILYGLPSSNWGNGGLSNAIVLNNNNFQQEKQVIEFGSSFGSFNNRSNFLKLSSKINRIHTSFKFYHQNLANNFKFLNQDDNLSSQTNSNSKQIALMADLMIPITKKGTIDFTYFGQKLERQIPPTLFEGPSNAIQNDDNHRIFLNFKYQLNHGLIFLKSAYYNEKNVFSDTSKSIYGYNPGESFINQLEYQASIYKKHQFTLNITQANSNSKGNNFNNSVNINRTSFTNSISINSKHGWKHLLNTRTVIDQRKVNPLTFSYGVNKSFNDKLSLFSNFGKVYRLPTINDLYWNPGGNIELKPENGYSTDLGLKWNKKIGLNILSFEPSLYSRWIEDWIQWQPNGSYWSPLNIKTVWNRGIETTTSLNRSFQNLRLKACIKTAYNISTNLDLYNSNEFLLNKQLIYVPHYKAVAKIVLEFKNINLTYLHNYTGYRFTSRDNISFLPAFNLGRIFISSKLKLKNQDISITYKINNIYNSNYQLVLNRPMPLVNHEFGLTIKLINNKQKL